MSDARSEVFCDFFTITSLPDNLDLILSALRPYFYDLGCTEEPGAFRLPDGYGLFTYRRKFKVSIFAASGLFASALRERSLLSRFLSEFFFFPHRVSSVDFTVDQYISAPERLHEIYKAAKAGEISFTRKALTPSSITFLSSQVCYADTGQDTGTVYLGRRGSHEVFAKVYDKRQQMAQTRMISVRDTLRHELTVTGKMGVTLKDIVQPHDCFYHFYPSNLLSTAQKSEWVGDSEGFTLEKPRERLPSAVLRQRLETSRDLQAMFGLCDEIGDNGLTYLISQLKKLYSTRKSALPA